MNRVRGSFATCVVFAVTCLAISTASHAVTVPFTEDFSSGDAGFTNDVNAAPIYSATGGPGGSAYIRNDFNFSGTSPSPFPGSPATSPPLFRAGSTSSGGAFVGNWITDGVSQISFDVRHDITGTVDFYARFASPTNFPGATAVSFTPVATNTWQTITIDINPSNPEFVSFSGTNFNTVFSNIGIVQFGIVVPSGLIGQNVNQNIDLANVNVIPEPASVMTLLGLGSVVMLRRSRLRNR